MTDNSELKRLAEAANAVTGGVSVDIAISSERGPNQPEIDAVTAFVGAATPAAVLALIAENEELGRYLCTCRDCGGEGALHTGDWHSYGHMEPPEPVMEKCGECDGTGLLGKIQDLYQVITERDQLRAEVAGLKTGYEAYEQVNAELKAEVEGLRQIISDSATSCGAAVSVECTLDFMKHLPVEIFTVISKLRNALAECADSLHGEMLQKFGGQLPDDMHPVTRREYDRDMAEVAGYRAALGQGEQS